MVPLTVDCVFLCQLTYLTSSSIDIPTGQLNVVNLNWDYSQVIVAYVKFTSLSVTLYICQNDTQNTIVKLYTTFKL